MDSRSSNNDENKWVEERIAKLAPPPGWRPDSDKAFEKVLQRGKPNRIFPALRVLMAGATLAAIAAVVLLVPWKALWKPESHENTVATPQAVEPAQEHAEVQEAVALTGPVPQVPTVAPRQAPEVTLPRAITAAPEPQKDAVPPLAQGQAPPQGGVTQPIPISQVQPQYTDEARQARVQGTVELAVTVKEDGTVRLERIVRSLGYGLDEAAANAVMQWKFIPGKKDGKPLDVIVNLTFHFALK